MTQLHPRTMPVQKAEAELGQLVCDWMGRHDLTYLEALRALQTVQSSWFKSAIRAERHPDDPEKRGDEE